jgi:hypothetical protein
VVVAVTVGGAERLDEAGEEFGRDLGGDADLDPDGVRGLDGPGRGAGGGLQPAGDVAGAGFG